MIYKLQRAIFPPDADILAYDEGRTQQHLIPWDGTWAAMFETCGLAAWGRRKFFAEAHVEDGTFVVDKVFKEDLGW